MLEVVAEVFPEVRLRSAKNCSGEGRGRGGGTKFYKDKRDCQEGVGWY